MLARVSRPLLLSVSLMEMKAASSLVIPYELPDGVVMSP